MSNLDFLRSDNTQNNDNIVLSEEQKIFMAQALSGNNILVDACIGSGKTTAIQYLCDVIPHNLCSVKRNNLKFSPPSAFSAHNCPCPSKFGQGRF